MFISEDIIGEGACANVKKVKIGDCLYAIKIFKKGKGKREYEIHRLFNHPNVLTCIVGNADFIVSELMLCDLFSLIEANGPISINAANCILRSMVSALQHIHSLGYAHRDVKLENILVDNNYQVKLCDFNLSEHESNGLVERNIGTDGFIAPELNKFGDIDASALKECDIFSLGVTYFILICGKPPIKRADCSCQYWNLIKKNQWNEFWYYALKSSRREIPEKSRWLVEGMMHPNRRISLEGILERIGEVDEVDYVMEMKKIHLNLDRRRP